jgi:hypothetical protein
MNKLTSRVELIRAMFKELTELSQVYTSMFRLIIEHNFVPANDSYIK